MHFVLFFVTVVTLLGSGHAIKVTSLSEKNSQDVMGYRRPNKFGIKRTGESGYIRFGKRSYPDSLINEIQDLDSRESQQRMEEVLMANLPQRFQNVLLDEKCLEQALNVAKDVSHLHRLIVKNGCWEVAKRTTSKKDGYIRFGKRSEEEPSEYPNNDYDISK